MGSETPTTAEPQVIHPEVVMAKFGDGNPPLTVDLAKEYLGWEVVGKDDPFPGKFFMTDELGNKVRLHNNMTNRPYAHAWALTLAQKHLMRQWKLNGEPIIIDNLGNVQSGQHRLVSLVLAEQVRTGPKAPYWRQYWDGPVTMETMMVFGIKPDDDVVNTIDTGKSRSLTDVIFRSDLFRDRDVGNRKELSRLCDYAVKFVWARSGQGNNAFHNRRTHEEFLGYLARHPRLVEAVVHVHKEDSDGAIGKYLPAGAAAGLFYLCATSGTDRNAYKAVDPPSEEAVDFSRWEWASDFWVRLTSGSADFDPVRAALAALVDEHTGKEPTREMKLAVLALAWNEWIAGGDGLTEDNLKPRFEPYEPGDARHLAETPSVGGIDLGDPDAVADADEEQEGQAETTDKPRRKGKPTAEDGPQGEGIPTPEEIARRAKEVRDAQKKVFGDRPVTDILQEIRADNPGKTLVFKAGSGWKLWGVDAKEGKKHAGLQPVTDSATRLQAASFADSRFWEIAAKLMGAGLELLTVELDPKAGLIVNPVTTPEGWGDLPQDEGQGDGVLADDLPPEVTDEPPASEPEEPPAKPAKKPKAKKEPAPKRGGTETAAKPITRDTRRGK